MIGCCDFERSWTSHRIGLSIGMKAVYIGIGKEREKREYLKEVQMDDDGGMNDVFGCRGSCGEF